jgi:NADH dehydrogenase [ubiquinone] 1 alpha subcomplex assembly factor 1
VVGTSRILPRKLTHTDLTFVAIKQEGFTIPSAPYKLLDFRNPDTRSACKTMYDGDMGGFSTVHLDQIAGTIAEPAHVHFYGKISTELPPKNPALQRSGYAAWRSRDPLATLFGRGFWNIDPYAYVGLRVKSDGRKFFVNVQTDSIVPEDLHQHRLYTRTPGEWETVMIKWNDFVRTNHGIVAEPQTEMLRQRVKSIGIGLTDRVNGPYSLLISQIWATNNPQVQLPDAETDES